MTPSRSSGSRLTVVLRCEECSATAEWRPWFKLTKMGVLRLEGGSHGFYVDGGRVLCARCKGECANNPAQRETWSEYDRRCVESDQEDRAFLESVAARYPGLEVRDD